MFWTANYEACGDKRTKKKTVHLHRANQFVFHGMHWMQKKKNVFRLIRNDVEDRAATHHFYRSIEMRWLLDSRLYFVMMLFFFLSPIVFCFVFYGRLQFLRCETSKSSDNYQALLILYMRYATVYVIPWAFWTAMNKRNGVDAECRHRFRRSLSSL